jgi:tetratricopeptide (TPR) repeat protein
MKSSLLVFYIFLSIVFLKTSRAQNIEITDSLEKVAESNQQDSVRIHALMNLSITFQANDSARALSYARRAKKISKGSDSNWEKAIPFYLFAQVYLMHNEYKKSLEYFEQADSLLKRSETRTYGIVLFYHGDCHSQLGNYNKAIQKYRQALKIFQKKDEKLTQAYCHNSIGNILWFQGYFKRASEEYQKSLQIFKDKGRKSGIAPVLNNIAILYFELEDYDNALDYYSEGLEIYKELNDSSGIAMIWLNTGEIYWKKKEYEKAMDYYTRSLDLSEKQNMPQNAAYCLTNIGIIYLETQKFQLAEKYFDDAMKYWEDLEDRTGLIYCLNYIGILEYKTGNYTKAIKTLHRCRKIAEAIGAQDEMRRAYETLSKAYEATKNYEKALVYHKQFKQLNDTIFNGETNRKLAELEATHEIEKREQQIKIQKAQLTAKDAQIKKEKVLRKALIGGLIGIAIFVLLGTYSYLKIRKAKKKITEQKTKIEKQKNSIDDSIRYAKRIQTAVLPSSKYARTVMGPHFILFRPKEIVSGDFYWATQVNEWNIFTVSDCTGHGVPGAFMSMLGVSFLNEIVRKKEITKSSDVLNELRRYVIEALKQSGKTDSQKDGMDMSFVAINSKNNKCYWAGANNPLWIIRKEKTNGSFDDSANMIEEIKGDKMPVSIHVKMNEFTHHEVQLEEGDRIYLFSDGFQDQFGGPKGKKYKSKPLKRLLAETSELPIAEQGLKLENELDNWMNGFTGDHKQIDDITMMGVEIK